MSFSAARLIAGCSLTALGGAALAHHGFGNFDNSAELMTLEGVVTDVDFVNPHSWVYFTVTDEAGATQDWRCELRAATVLRRSGWTPEMFAAGTRMTVTGLPDRNDPRSCYVSNVLFADGRTFNRYAQIGSVAELAAIGQGPRPQRFADGTLNISGDWAPTQMLLTDPRVGGVPRDNPQSSPSPTEAGAQPPAPGARGARQGAVQPTEAAQAVIAATDFRSPEGNPRFRCETTSILFDWNWDGSVNRVTQRGDTITLEHGQHGFTRTIHLNLDAHPAGIEPSRGGHSIGRWEGDVLVVDTVGFAPGLLTGQIVHSGELHVVERFALDTERMALTRDYVAEDSLFFVGQHTGTDTLFVADVPFEVHDCKELMNVDYSVESE